MGSSWKINVCVLNARVFFFFLISTRTVASMSEKEEWNVGRFAMIPKLDVVSLWCKRAFRLNALDIIWKCIFSIFFYDQIEVLLIVACTKLFFKIFTSFLTTCCAKVILLSIFLPTIFSTFRTTRVLLWKKKCFLLLSSTCF